MGKVTTKEMWDTLTRLYQTDYQSHKMMLKDKQHNTKMSKGESMTSYLSKMTQVKNELAYIGETISKDDLVCIALNGFLALGCFCQVHGWQRSTT